MQAVILVGGEGTRLRPLTSRRPKPVITLVDRPFMAYMLEWLRGHGIDDVVLSCGFLPTKMEEALGDGSSLGIRLRYVTEPEPRGTGGALKYAEDLLDDRFLMLNGDVLTDVDLGAQLAAHEASGAKGTLGLVPVDDPSAYGLVLLGEGGRVRGFLEKPGHDQLKGVGEYLISAGIYVLEREVLDLIPADKKVSIEREVWPRLVGDGLHGFAARTAYWMDIGTPERYLQGTADILTGAVNTAVLDRLDGRRQVIGDGSRIEGQLAGPAVVGRDVVVEPGAFVLGPAVLGDGVRIGADARVERSVLLEGARVGHSSTVADSVLGARAQVGDQVVLRERVMVGEDAVVGDRNVLARGMKVFPGVGLSAGSVAF